MSGFKPYPAYKDSGVEWLGEVPEHWALIPIKHLASLNPRKSDSRVDTQLLCSFVPMEKLKTGVLLLDEERHIKEVINGYTYFEDGDVLQAKVTPCFENKNIAIATGLTNGIGFGSSEINVLRPNRWVKPEYLYYRLQEDNYMDFCTSSMMGAGGLKRVPTEVINNFTIAAPGLAEQTQIARFLDHETARIDALIEEQQRLIELLKEKRQAVISHAVTKGLDPTVPMKDSGVEWLGEVPAHWGVLNFNLLVYIAEGQVNPRVQPYSEMLLIAPNHVESGTGRLTHTETAEGQGADSGKYVCQKGDVIYSKIRPALRKVCLAPEACLCSADMYPMRGVSGLDNEYLFWFILSEPFSAFALLESDRVAMPKINRESLGGLKLARPPLEEQKAISEFLVGETLRIDALIDEANSGVGLLNERRSALISAAVTGKIDVRGWQPAAHTQAHESAVAEAN